MNFFLFKSYLPECFLSICILTQLIYNSVLINELKIKPLIFKKLFYQSFFILVCVFLLLLNLKCETYFYNFLFVNDLGSIWLKLLVVAASLIILIIISQIFELQKLNFFEYFILYLLVIFSSLLLISVSDMLAGYLVLEMQALAFYVLAGFNRKSSYSTEAGIKYFITGSFISSLFLSGCLMIYGAFGTLNFMHLSLLFSILITKIDLNYYYYFLLVGNFFIIITFLFKLAIVPFHFWAPDIYDGSPLVSTIILTILPKIALVYFLIKWLLVIQVFFSDFFLFFEVIGVLSILVGIGFAIKQKRLKRLMIYSSISQLGFLAAALSNLNINTLSSIFFFLVVYILSSLAFWLYMSNISNFQNEIRVFYNQSISMLFLNSFSNAFKINPIWSYSLLIIFFSFAGLPPFSGFFSKVFLIICLIESHNSALAILILTISLISAFYYLRFLKIVFYEPTVFKLHNNTSQVIFASSFFYFNCLVGVFLLFFMIYFFYNPTILFLFCQKVVINLYFF